MRSAGGQTRGGCQRGAGARLGRRVGGSSSLTACPQVRAKRLLDEEEKEAANKIRRMGAEHKNLFTGCLLGRMLDVDGSLVVSAGKMEKSRSRLRKILGQDRVTKNHVANLDTIMKSGKTIVWLVPRELIQHVIAGRLLLLDDELKSVCVASRLLGGFLVDEEWVDASVDLHERRACVPQPVARLKAAVKTTVRELVIDASVGAYAAWATAVLHAVVDGIKNPASRWTIRPARKDIKKEKDGLVLLGSAAMATADAEKKKVAHDKVKGCENAVKKCITPAAKATARKDLALAAKIKLDLRGRGMSMENFAKTIAEFD